MSVPCGSPFKGPGTGTLRLEPPARVLANLRPRQGPGEEDRLGAGRVKAANLGVLHVAEVGTSESTSWNTFSDAGKRRDPGQHEPAATLHAWSPFGFTVR